VSKDEQRTLKERAEAWNRGEFDAMPQPENPDDVTLAQPKLPTTSGLTPGSSTTPSTYAKRSYPPPT
jgi:hypothetical protein